jgi:hypothetical protein
MIEPSFSESQVQFLDLRSPKIDPQERERLCLLFYHSVYKDAFPKIEHSETPETWLPLLSGNGASHQPVLNIILATGRAAPPAELDEADVLGGVIFEYFPKCEAGLITYLCVAEQKRKTGLARRLLGHAVAACKRLSKTEHVLIFAETENPKRMSEDDLPKCSQRLQILDALGFQYLPIAYRQPPLARDTPWSDDLLLLVYTPNGSLPLTRQAISDFLTTFETSLMHNSNGRPIPTHDPFFNTPTESIFYSQPLFKAGRYMDRPTLGNARAQSIRFNFFRNPKDFFPALSPQIDDFSGFERPIPLANIYEFSARSENAAMRRLIGPMQSFISDITISEEGDYKLPIVALCEEGGDESPLWVTIRLPMKLITSWEGKDVETLLGDSGDVVLHARFVDTICIFASNHLAYSLTFVLEAASPSRVTKVETAKLLALMSLAGSAGALSKQERESIQASIRFEFAGNSYSLDEFASARLRTLCLADISEKDPTLRDKLLEGWRTEDEKLNRKELSLFADCPKASSEVFGAILRPLVNEFYEGSDNGVDRNRNINNARIAFCTVTLGDLRGITAEIVNFDRFQDAMRAIELAKTHAAPLNEFTRQLAGLAQDVIDYDEQDKHEINDSLLATEVGGGYLNFIHRNSIIRIYNHSRSFNQMQIKIGGCPYFYLTTICASFNEYLVVTASREIAAKRPTARRLRFVLSLNGRSNEAEAKRIEESFIFFERFIADSVPNLFRYASEAQLFNKIEESRGIARQRRAGHLMLEQLNQYSRDKAGQAREWVESLLAVAIFTLTLWQVFGVIWETSKDSFDNILDAHFGFKLAETIFVWLTPQSFALALMLTTYFVFAWTPTVFRSWRSARQAAKIKRKRDTSKEVSRPPSGK